MFIEKEFIRRYRRAINPPYRHCDVPYIFVTLLTIFSLVFLDIFLIQSQSSPLNSLLRIQKSNAQAQQTGSEFISNELLIKVKRGVRANVKEGNPQDTGISSLNNVLKQHKATGFVKIAKAGKNAKADADIFSWYKITLEGGREKITGNIEEKNGKLTFSNPKANRLLAAITSLRNDPNIETVEPNPIVTTNQTAPSLSTGSTQVSTGYIVSINWNNIPNPTTSDWIGLYAPGDPDASPRSKQYTNFIDYLHTTYCLTTPPGTANARGFCYFSIPQTTTSGSYEFRYFSNDTFTKIATSNTFTVTQTQLTASPNSASPGQSVIVSWDTIYNAYAYNWIGLYAQGASDSAKIDWMYVSCSKTVGNYKPSGGCEFPLPTTLAPGTYEFRLYYSTEPNLGYRLATSNQITVGTTTPTLTPSTTATSTPIPTQAPLPCSTTPHDPYYCSTGSWNQSYPDLWGLKKINTDGAWQQTTGSPNIVVADIDTGVDRNHEDLVNNMWVNTNEIPNNGIDDDNNGYVDDYYGWNFVGNNNSPLDDNGHGTHTAGTIAAVGNNGVGVVGLSWTSKIMTVKFLDTSGSGTIDNAVKAIQYAADMGAKVSSNSWGCQCQSKILDDAITYAHDKGMVVVAAAGNSSADALDFSPASSDYAITVAASDPNDAKASFSNGGPKIDVAAPGVDILSTRASLDTLCAPSNTVVATNYCRLSGTSMATPHVAGLAALLLAKNPTLTNEEIRQLIRTGATDLGSPGKDNDFGFGRIDAGTTLVSATNKPLAPIITSPRNRTTISGSSFQILGGISGPNFAQYTLEVGAGRSPTSWTQITNAITQVTSGVLGTVNPEQLGNGLYTFRLTATTTDGKTYQYQVFDVSVDNLDPAISLPFQKIASLEDSRQILTNPPGFDMNKNGKKEFVIESETGDTWSQVLKTYEGSANNTFANVSTISVPGIAYNTYYRLSGSNNSVDDGDGDGLTELITNGYTNNVNDLKVYESSSSNGYPDHVSWQQQIASWPYGALFADTDGDGKKEIITLANPYQAPNLTIYENTSNDSYQKTFEYTLPNNPTGPQILTVGDVDGDGKPEILVATIQSLPKTSSKVYILKSTGDNAYQVINTIDISAYDGNFINPSQMVYAGDLDGDGHNEFLVGGVSGVYPTLYAVYNLYESSGNNSYYKVREFKLPLTSNGDLNALNQLGLAVGDVTGDGKKEIIVGGGNTIQVYQNTRDNVYQQIWQYANAQYTSNEQNRTIGIGDHDGDGIAEILFEEQGKTSVYELAAPATTPTPIPPSLTPLPTSTPTPTPSPIPTATLTPTPTPIPTYAITGTVYNDTNRNGAQDTGEAGSVGTQVTLTGATTAITTTDVNGNYAFASTGGVYTVSVTVPASYSATTTNPVSIPILNANTTVNFGIAPIPTNTPTPKPSFTPTPTPGPLTISNVKTTNITSTQATITWTTSGPGTSRVTYGPSSNNLSQSSLLISTLTTTHAVTLGSLSNNKTYYYRIYSKNAAGTEYSSSVQSFKTLVR